MALARILSLSKKALKEHERASVSPFEWDRKAWSQEHSFQAVGLPLDPGNEVLAAALWTLMVVGEVALSVASQ